MSVLDQAHWENRYREGKTGWDIGYASAPIVRYMDGLIDKDLKILIPGAGYAYEAEYCHQKGFSDVHVQDIAPSAVEQFKERCSDFASGHVHLGDFFEHLGLYDLIIEQTFFCAIDRELRRDYVQKCYDLLRPGGKVIGLLWSKEMSVDTPPFGGTEEEYRMLFAPLFTIDLMTPAPDSIKPRLGTELFIELTKR